MRELSWIEKNDIGYIGLVCYLKELLFLRYENMCILNIVSHLSYCLAGDG